jgi:3-mercaptopyruvate sulfurtransferase SseA
VVYGRTVSRHYDEEVAWLLKERGFSDVRLLEDGLGAWEQGGNPVRRAR